MGEEDVAMRKLRTGEDPGGVPVSQARAFMQRLREERGEDMEERWIEPRFYLKPSKEAPVEAVERVPVAVVPGTRLTDARFETRSVIFSNKAL